MVDQNCTYLFQRRSTYYYSRRVPKELQPKIGRQRIVVSLKTRSLSKANRFGQLITQKLDEDWLFLRLGKQLGLASGSTQILAPTLSATLKHYLQLRGKDKSKNFHQTAHRNTRLVIDMFSDKALNEYSSVDAGGLRDRLMEQRLSPMSVRRAFTCIKAIFNFGLAEYGIDCANPFARIHMPEATYKKRLPIPIETIRAIQSACFEIDDDLRWLVALISDTGMRLSEAAGLAIEDICLNHQVPHINLKPHPWRRLKTQQSERQVPLVGAALWAAKRITTGVEGQWCFPRYTNAESCNGNSASAALNKWLKANFSKEAVVHGFRNSFRDRLRAVNCPTKMIDQLGGWSIANVGGRYGQGYNLKSQKVFMDAIIIKAEHH
ncbi:tyrosine-type recombinase/integrase [Alphaproteobacteria bacterium]|nr:tyrosine-type recombinase/integrase [Alphaproteobacteria bacterium]